MLKITWTAGRRSLNGLMLVLSLIGFATPGLAEVEVSSGVDLKFWGRVKFDMQYDTEQMAVDFMSFLTDDHTEQFSFNPRDSRLGFRASSTQEKWTFSGEIEIDFYGSNTSNNLVPRLRLGFAEAKNSHGLSLRGGQDWVPVAQQNPGTIDFGIQSWSGNLWWRVPQLTLRYKPDNIEVLVSAMKHRVSNSQEQMEKMPWLLGRVGFSDFLGEGSLVALGAGYRSANDLLFSKTSLDWTEPLPPTEVVTTSLADYQSYLVALELKVPFGGGWEANGEIYTGQGIGREFVHYGFDYNPWHPDGAREINSQGGFLNLKIPAGKKIHFNVGFGLDDPRDEDLKDSSAPYLKNQTIFGNLNYAVTRHFGWGLEVIGFTTTVAEADASRDIEGQRFTASMWYVF